MNNEFWFEQIEDRILTIVKTRMTERLGDEYPTMFFTSDGEVHKDMVFPTVYVRELTGYENGRDLDNTTINAIMETLQMEVYSDSGKADCKNIMHEVINQMKALRFNVMAMPIYQQNGNVDRGVARFRRMIGAGDTDIIIPYKEEEDEDLIVSESGVDAFISQDDDPVEEAFLV